MLYVKFMLDNAFLRSYDFPPPEEQPYTLHADLQQSSLARLQILDQLGAIYWADVGKTVCLLLGILHRA